MNPLADLGAAMIGVLASIGLYTVIRGSIVGWKRKRLATASAVPEQRLERIEQAIELVTVEMERVSEAQRFTSNLLLERLPPRAPEQLAPRASRAPGTITPH